MSKRIKVDAKVMTDLNEFLIKTFRDAAHISDSEEPSRRNSINPEANDIDAFDYVNQDSIMPAKKRPKKLSKTQKRARAQFINDACNVLMPSSEEEEESSQYDSLDEYNSESDDDISK